MDRIPESRLRFSWNYDDVIRTDDILGERGYRCPCGENSYLTLNIQGEVVCEFCEKPVAPFVVLKEAAQ